MAVAVQSSIVSQFGIKAMSSTIEKELLEVLQSSNINLLIGSGASTPFLPLLGNIEKSLNEAPNEEARIVQYKKYLEEVMLPNKILLNPEPPTNDNFDKTKKSYLDFFGALTTLILKRKSTILSKQINLFTTNIDILMETTLEELQVEYNDGFSGKFKPSFSIANFKKSYFQRSLHFEHISEIPVFNIIKMHGSTTWVYNKNKDRILFSKSLEHISDELLSKSGSEFVKDYRKILVVNPEEAKHLESVLNVYYSELLRMYSSELEKENTSLFVLGFSMEDMHIREITIRAAKSNPTLRIFACCKKSEVEKMEKSLDTQLCRNIQVFSPEDEESFFTIDLFAKLILGKINVESHPAE